MGKVFWTDTETTGVFESSCAIVQLAGLIEIDGKIVEEFNLRARPHNGAFISDEALKVTGLDEATIMAYPPHEEMYNDLVRTLNKYVNKFNKKDKFVIAGYNIHFDDGFLRQLFSRCNNKYYGGLIAWPKIDAANLVAEEYVKGLRLSDHKLGTLCAHFGIALDAHDALGDIKATRELYYRLRGGNHSS
jgi:DNA polymerase III subunit epsilon